MVEGPSDDSGDGGRADEGKVLTPQELDITDSEYVEQIDEGRFVVSPDTRGPEPTPKGGGSEDGSQRGGESNASAPSGGSQRGGGGGTGPQNAGGGAGRAGGAGGDQPPQGEPARSKQSASRGRGRSPNDRRSKQGLTEQEVRNWLRQKYQQSNSKYAFDVTAQFDGKVSQRQLASNDLVTVFESLMLWYGQEVDSSMPVEEVLGILLNESNVPIRYPPESVRNLVRSTDLGPNDTIADLLEAVQDDDGVKL